MLTRRQKARKNQNQKSLTPLFPTPPQQNRRRIGTNTPSTRSPSLPAASSNGRSLPGSPRTATSRLNKLQSIIKRQWKEYTAPKTTKEMVEHEQEVFVTLLGMLGMFSKLVARTSHLKALYTWLGKTLQQDVLTEDIFLRQLQVNKGNPRVIEISKTAGKLAGLSKSLRKGIFNATPEVAEPIVEDIMRQKDAISSAYTSGNIDDFSRQLHVMEAKMDAHLKYVNKLKTKTLAGRLWANATNSKVVYTAMFHYLQYHMHMMKTNYGIWDDVYGSSKAIVGHAGARTITWLASGFTIDASTQGTGFMHTHDTWLKTHHPTKALYSYARINFTSSMVKTALTLPPELTAILFTILWYGSMHMVGTNKVFDQLLYRLTAFIFAAFAWTYDHITSVLPKPLRRNVQIINITNNTRRSRR
jgi:hypothetical protein